MQTKHYHAICHTRRVEGGVQSLVGSEVGDVTTNEGPAVVESQVLAEVVDEDALSLTTRAPGEDDTTDNDSTTLEGVSSYEISDNLASSEGLTSAKTESPDTETTGRDSESEQGVVNVESSSSSGGS